MADLSNSDVTTKYQEAAKIANFALEGVVKQCVPGSKIIDICVFGDAIIQAVSEYCIFGVCFNLFLLKGLWQLELNEGWWSWAKTSLPRKEA